MADRKSVVYIHDLKPLLTPEIQMDRIKDLSEAYSKVYQLNLQPPSDKGLKYKLELWKWENNMNSASGNEPRITVENRVDFASFPPFQYTKNNVAGPGVCLKPDPAYLVGCDCQMCTEEQCTCPKYSDGEFAYDSCGKVKLDRRRPIYECNMNCSCEKSCRNRVVQRGRTGKVCIFRTKKKGWGLKTLEYIHANQFVTEYVGEIITNEEAERRGKEYDEMGQTYLFDLDYNEGECLFTIDAYHYGNVAHFINHSCDPNLIVYGVWINNMDTHLPHIALFAIRDIQPGEELTFDYLMTGADASATPGPSPKKRMQCHCKSTNCRKWLF